MDRPFECPDRRTRSGRSVMEDERHAVDWTAHPEVETPAVVELDLPFSCHRLIFTQTGDSLG